MLTLPASKVSVPLAVVSRTLSRAPDKVTSPAKIREYVVDNFKVPLATHRFDPIDAIVIIPEIISAAVFEYKKNPVVLLPVVTVAPKKVDEETYPLVVNEPDPI